MAGTHGVIRKALAALAVAIALAYLAFCLLLYLSQGSYIYQPVPRRGDAQAFVMHRDGVDVVVSSNGVESRDAVLYFGGNAEDASQAIPQLAQAFPGRAVYAMHYRGYGGSGGAPSEHALVADGGALLANVAANHPRIVLVGRSLGSGIAIQLADHASVQRLVLVTPYDSIEALAEERFPWVPVRLLLRDKFASLDHASRVRGPTTILAAGRDQVIPAHHLDRLVAAFPRGKVQVVRFAQAGHNDIAGFDGYVEALAGRRR